MFSNWVIFTSIIWIGNFAAKSLRKLKSDVIFKRYYFRLFLQVIELMVIFERNIEFHSHPEVIEKPSERNLAFLENF